MLEARLVQMERRREMKDRLAVLNRRDSAAREAPAVARTVDEVDDRRGEIARAEEVAVNGMRIARRLDRSLRGDERLRKHLAAEHTTGADIAVLPAIDIDLEWFEIEQGEQFVQRFGNTGSLDWECRIITCRATGFSNAPDARGSFLGNSLKKIRENPWCC
jgi:hypothetical protein